MDLSSKKPSLQDISNALDKVNFAAIKNNNEQRVIKLMHQILSEDAPRCACVTCLEDIYALSLNKIAAHYAQAGSIIISGFNPPENEVIIAIKAAISVVSVAPNHSFERSRARLVAKITTDSKFIFP